MISLVSERGRHGVGDRRLVVDDEDACGFRLRHVATAASGLDAWNRLRTERFDLVVLDLMLPDLDGLEVCRRLRAAGDDTPVLFLTARTGPSERVAGLRVGGDDYVEKPFTLAEVVARVATILKRSRPRSAHGVVRVGDLVMMIDAHRVERGGTVVELTATEFRLLRYFMENAERVLSKSQILDHVWEFDFDGDSNVVETYVRYLRKKLDVLGPPMIHTIRLVGYVMRAGG